MRNDTLSGLAKEIKTEFTSQLRDMMKKRGFSVSRLAQESGISRSVLSGYLVMKRCCRTH